ncbi:MAG: dipeptidyl aminopeptidase/acylaminoacyl peptidase [Mariniblastus sp.]|jgi:dipeptidyl aminopeptidase/acylaminoacyl peptidase
MQAGCVFQACLGLLFLVSSSGESLARQTSYQLPPQEVIDIIDAAPEPSVRFSPDKKWMFLVDWDAMPDITDVSRKMLQLAGMRIDPVSNGGFQASFSQGLTLRTRDSAPDDLAAQTKLKLPAKAKITQLSWSHNSRQFAFVLATPSGQQLWAGSVEEPHPRMLTDRLNTVMGGFTWMPDGKRILCKLVPADRGPEPSPSLKPMGPIVQESSGNKSPTRTYQDLLQNSYDASLFEYYTTTQLAIVDSVGDSNIELIGAPQILSGVSPSPSGDFVLVTTIRRPFSYLMTYRSFPRSIQVWKTNQAIHGSNVHTVVDVPMDENIPIEGVREGPRSVDWKSGVPATLVWAEALDGGDPNKETEHRDRYMIHAAPFNDSQPAELLKVQHRAYGMSCFSDPSVVVTTEYDRDRRWVRTLMHDLKMPGTTPKALMDRSIRDRYGDPGWMMSIQDETGHVIARQDGDWVYRAGAGASPQGNLPFVDRQNLKTLETERLWRCEEGTYESFVGMVSSNEESKPTVITNRESPTSPPNYFIRNLDGETSKPLTHFVDPTPQIRGIKKQLVKYKRSDGVPLSATLYLPADYQPGKKLPLLVWAYPREFSDAKTASQISGSPSQFTRMQSISHLTLLTQGYAIMDTATMPVIGDPETMNDTFIAQVVDAAQAAIDKAVEMGVADRDRVCVGGHSYGAFMTANLMAHCDLFKAGVARSGAYNRTLTPFGFQSERRPYWEAKDIYHSLSPFLHADKINEPLLLIHGENDNNSGTFPIQSKRMYQAIKGNGGTVRLCVLPYESHFYRARQSVLHTQAETIAWLDKYVKHASAD